MATPSRAVYTANDNKIKIDGIEVGVLPILFTADTVGPIICEMLNGALEIVADGNYTGEH